MTRAEIKEVITEIHGKIKDVSNLVLKLPRDSHQTVCIETGMLLMKFVQKGRNGHDFLSDG